MHWRLKRAVFGGYDWGGRAACIGAALWPERCAGLVSVNGYLIQDIARAMTPAKPEREVPLWYQYYFQTRARPGRPCRQPARYRDGSCGSNGRRTGSFDDACFERTALAHDNPDYVDVVDPQLPPPLRPCRRRSALADIQRRLAALPVIAVPAITLDGDADGVVPATDGTAQAAKFSGPRLHRVVPRAGHNLPQEEPEAFAAAVMELIKA